MNWKPGDRAICITPGSRICGLEVTIVSGLRHGGTELNGHYRGQHDKYTIDPGFPPPYRNHWCAWPENLKPIYDGNETVSWESCVWKPNVVTT